MVDAKALITVILTLLLCAARPVKVGLFGVANNIAYVVRVDDSTFVQIAPGNKDGFYFLVDADSGTVVHLISGMDTTISEVSAPDGTFITVYPNPSEGFLTINSEGDRRFDLYTVSGAHILSIPLKSGAVTVELPTLASGVYFWRSGRTTGKLTIVR